MARQQLLRRLRSRQRNVRHFSGTVPRSTNKPETEPLPQTRIDSEETTTTVLRPYFEKQQPLVIKDALSTNATNAAAMGNFQDWNYLEELVDTLSDCRVEIGGNYSRSQIADVPFVDFLSFMRMFEDKFGRKLEENKQGDPPSDLIYLAQNDIFPELLSEIHIPDFCSQIGEGKVYSTMMWMGPYGCISPLHFDPLDNILMQFVGQKKCFLCAPHNHVYAGAGGNQHNTSPLDPEEEITSSLAKKYPSVRDVRYQEATLEAGDILYIPKKWYHHIRTVQTSVSINTWFR